MNLFLSLLLSILTLISARRSKSEPPPSSRTKPNQSKPLFLPTDAKVSVWGPGALVTSDGDSRRTQSVERNCFRTDSLTRQSSCVAISATHERGRAMAKVKAERARFLLRTGPNGLGSMVAKGQGQLTGSIRTQTLPPVVEGVNEEVNGSKQILVGPNSHLQGFLTNHGRGRGRVSVTATHAGTSNVALLGHDIPHR